MRVTAEDWDVWIAELRDVLPPEAWPQLRYPGIDAIVRRYGIPRGTLIHRLSAGVPLRDAVRREKRKARRNRKPGSIASLALAHDMSPSCLQQRLRRGLDLETALRLPLPQARVTKAECERWGINRATVYYRMNRGMSVTEALRTPVRESRVST